MELEVTYEKVDLRVTGSYEPYIPGTPYLRNGDPGDPPEGGYFEATSIKLDGQELISILSEDAIGEIELICYDMCDSSGYDDDGFFE
jgi:hypothetical protein